MLLLKGCRYLACRDRVTTKEKRFRILLGGTEFRRNTWSLIGPSWFFLNKEKSLLWRGKRKEKKKERKRGTTRLPAKGRTNISTPISGPTPHGPFTRPLFSNAALYWTTILMAVPTLSLLPKPSETIPLFSLLIRPIDLQPFPLLFPNDPLNSIHFVLVTRYKYK